ncbi:hypothetical protein PVAP13_4KG230400 [Panicum virgatum]|uniref:Uncharacterized protein n=1 Tax=Panicum virgatum TaxID=38727 RepID=A0A8T0TR58_PANVG|nr:hypothetical protein PVAP13_4KG230400 [Panicum virgatum]
MSSNTCFCLIRRLIVGLSLLVLVSSLTAGSFSWPPCWRTDPNNPCPPSCSPHSPSWH